MQKIAISRHLIAAIGRAGAVLALTFGTPANAGAISSPGCKAGGEPATVATVDPSLDLHLADGRIAHLAGVHVEPVEFGRDTDAQTKLTAWLTAGGVNVLPIREEPDRWGRTVALVFAPAPNDAHATVSVGEALLDAGWATADPDASLETCWPTYLQIEDEARRSRSGLWSGSNGVLDPADRLALMRRLGSRVLVEGRIGSAREGHSRLYLRFANDAGTGMAVAVDHAAERRLARSLGPPDTWVGRRLLGRGLLDDRWGLQVDVSSPQQVSVTPP